MATYVMLVNFTQKGIEDIKHGPDRLTAAKERVRKSGGEIKAFYLTMGQYDAIIIMEGPNDETVATGILQAASQGYIRTRTLRAFPENDYRKIVAALP
ncbi:MAG TPA: GYD domain-containing protein [bacterium]|nr:GYD domain-containing protein [bacterium]